MEMRRFGVSECAGATSAGGAAESHTLAAPPIAPFVVSQRFDRHLAVKSALVGIR